MKLRIARKIVRKHFAWQWNGRKGSLYRAIAIVARNTRAER